MRASNRKKLVRYSLLAVNIVVLVAVIGFVTYDPGGQTAQVATKNATTTDQELSNPLDELSSADIAVNVARVTRLPEATSVTNLADTVNTQLAVASGDNVISAQPHIVATGLPSRKDIRVYTAKKGDTVAKIAANFGVTSNSVRWSNDISGNTVAVGKVLYIPPVDGIVYKVLPADTIDSIARRYSANKEKLIVINDLEGGSLPVGERIIIPDGSPPTVSTASRSTYNAYAPSSGLAFGDAPIYGYNGYDYGWCTYYAASRVSVPTNWGNANSWDEGARSSGWTVSQIPVPGAIAQSNSGWAGHVAVVDAVKSVNGQYYIRYSDMNGLAGFGRVGSSGWIPANAKYDNYIYR